MLQNKICLKVSKCTICVLVKVCSKPKSSISGCRFVSNSHKLEDHEKKFQQWLATDYSTRRNDWLFLTFRTEELRNTFYQKLLSGGYPKELLCKTAAHDECTWDRDEDGRVDYKKNCRANCPPQLRITHLQIRR